MPEQIQEAIIELMGMLSNDSVFNIEVKPEEMILLNEIEEMQFDALPDEEEKPMTVISEKRKFKRNVIASTSNLHKKYISMIGR